MDVQGLPPWPQGSGKTERGRFIARPSRSGALSPERVGEALGEWQAGEVRLAGRFAECRGLDAAQLEDLYQETTLALLHRPYNSEEHLRNALRFGLKNRALHLHRDERRRGEILADRALEMHVSAMARDEQGSPEPTLLARHDQLIVKEFMTELTALEKKVFGLEAEGMGYRAIAPILGVPVNQARKANRSSERKRERFQLLHDTGRLCGYRSQTIEALKAGEAASEQLVLGAYAHLDACSQCRAEHRTNAERLRRSFQEKAAALLPIGLLTGHLGWLSRLELRIRSLQQRLAPYSSPPGSGGMRERGAALLAGGASAKLAAGVATVAVIAGGAIGATHALEHSQRHSDRGTARRKPVTPTPQSTTPVTAPLAPSEGPAHVEAQGRPQSQRGPTEGQAASHRREPGGFAYLGVPSGTPPAARASSASAGGGGSSSGSRQAEQRGGGPFSP
jgi:RNA polymerase sigma factor (sigma-70 family)